MIRWTPTNLGKPWAKISLPCQTPQSPASWDWYALFQDLDMLTSQIGSSLKHIRKKTMPNYPIFARADHGYK
ncbi:hypothetical protein GFB64_09050 [Lacticaseibacillus paracasei]|nr:hypothetical protein GFB64_09050 [Lacticaseibacillus paracasei]